MKNKENIIFTGIYLAPCVWLIEIVGYVYLQNAFNLGNPNSDMIIAGLLLGLLPVLKAYSTNSIKKAHGKTVFTWGDGLENVSDEYSIKQNKARYAYPKIPEACTLSDKAIGIIVGMDSKSSKYVSLPANTHSIVLAPTGGGKTSGVIIPSILMNKRFDTDKLHSFFIIDVKKEIRQKSTYADDENVLCFDPDDRTSWGWDVFAGLGDKSKISDVLVVMQNIVYALIGVNHNDPNKYFSVQARNLLISLMTYYWQYGKMRNVIDIFQEILKYSAIEHIEKIRETAKKSDACYMYSTPFAKMAEETLGSVESTAFAVLLEICTNQDLVYLLRDCPRKIKPEMLEEGKDIIICIAEKDLTRFTNVLRLLVVMTLEYCNSRPENSEKEVHIILDEWPRICADSGLDLSKYLFVLRSKHCSVMMIYQNLESGYQQLTENGMMNQLANAWLVVLGINTVKSQEMISKMAGTYKEANESFSTNSGKKGKNLSYTEKSIIDANLLMEMSDKQEVLVITTNMKWFRVKKNQYFKDMELLKLSEAMKQSHMNKLRRNDLWRLEKN